MWYSHSRSEHEKAREKSMSLRIFTFLLCTFAFGTGSGCSGWFTRSEPLPEVKAEQLIELLREREVAVQTMKGLFRAQIQGPGIPIAQRVEGAVYYRRSDALRLQGFNRLGGELFEFILGAEVYMLRLPAGRILTGRPAELERNGSIARPFKLSVLAMSGVVGISRVTKDERTVLSVDGDRYRLDVFAGPHDPPDRSSPFRRLWFDRRSLQVVQEERLTSAGDVEATALFDDYRPVGSAVDGSISVATTSEDTHLLKPFRITVQDGQGRGFIFLTFHEIVPNAPIKPEELRLTGWSERRSGVVPMSTHDRLDGALVE
jgi:hypothetical protein